MTTNLPFWLSTHDTAIYTSTQRIALHSDIPIEDFSLGSFLHPNSFYGYYNSKSSGRLPIFDTGRCKARFEYDSKKFYIFFEFAGNVGKFELLWNRDIATDIIVSKNQASVDIYFLLLLAPRVSEALPLRLRHIVHPDISNIDGDNYRFPFKRMIEFMTCSADILGGSNCMRLRIRATDPQSQFPGVDGILSRLQSLGFRVNFTNVAVHFEKTTKDSQISKLSHMYLSSFAERWAFQVLISKGLLVSETIARDNSFLEDMASYSQKEPTQLEESLYQIADVVETRRFINLRQALKLFMSDDYKTCDILLPKLKKVRRLVATPTRCIFYPPHIMFDNRILRKYDPDFCLRVSFRDDDMQRLSNVRAEDDFYRRTIERRLEDGIFACDRHFEFLACSNSQLRDHGVWFYAEDDEGYEAEDIRDWMGDLSRIGCAATYVSRMGQCFSTSEDSITVEADGKKVTTDDKDVKKNGYTFSDGTGRISLSLAKKISKETGRTRVHSVYQIRYGGCKGTVSLYPTLDGDSLIIRKSMRKFESDHQRLEIVKVSQPCQLYLNHQAVMLMDQLGVPNSVFLRLQEDMIEELVDMFIHERKAADALGKRASIGIKYGKLVDSGIQLTTDPFFSQMLHAVMGMHMRDMRDKARIEIPSTHGRNMFGAMDETKSLQHNEVFVQYSKSMRDPGASCEVVKGYVIVTKFPAVHQGDVRRFEAIDVPKLHHMVDCIVFPSEGPRPHPNEMAGSDLDGDEYFVTWLPDFLRYFPVCNAEAMNYLPPVKESLGRQVEFNDIITFVTEYIQNDRLGQISNAHKAFADSEEEGIFSPVCQILAEKHSEAVDFPKTGNCPEIDDDERPQVYPNFMGKQGQNTVYKSKRALGEMYDVSRRLDNLLRFEDKENSRSINLLSINENLIHRRHELYLPEARKTHERYSNTIRQLMGRYGIKSEAELVSGCIRSLHLRINQRDEKFETIHLVKLQMQEIWKRFRSMFFVEFGGEEKLNTKTLPEEVIAKASAWYVVSYSAEDTRALSFPWIVSDVLGHVNGSSVYSLPTGQHLKPSRPIDKIAKAMHDGYIEMRKRSSDTCVGQFIFKSETRTRQECVILNSLYQNNGLIPLVQFLLRWAEGEGLVSMARKQNMLTFQELVMLILQFAFSKGFISDPHIGSSGAMLISTILAEKTMSNTLFENVRSEKSSVSIGEILIGFLKFFGSQSLKQGKSYMVFGQSLALRSLQRLSSVALNAYHCLAVTGDVQELITGSLESQLDEISVVIPNNEWISIRRFCSYLEGVLLEMFGDNLTGVTIRRDSAGKYPSGRLWAAGNCTTMLDLEDLLATPNILQDILR